VGQVLRIPAVVVTSTNNDDGTFEAYDPTAIIGDTTPVIPQPPKKKSNPLKMILIIVAAVVITIFTAGALSGVATGFAQTMSAGLGVLTGGAAGGSIGLYAAAAASGSVLGTAGTLAIASAVGSIGSQLTGMALGEQSKFSWRQVGLSALAGGISAGLPSFAASPAANAMIKGAVSSTLSQGIGVATGLQESFSWRSVAASAVGAGVGQAVGPVFGDAFGNTAAGQFGARLATGLVAGTAAAAMRGGKFTIQQVAVDAFGNALGNSIAQGIAGGGSQQADRIPSNAGYRNEMDRASDAYRPAMNYNYRNGYDVQSDAYNPATEYGYRNGMDIASDNFNPASAYGYRNGSDVQSDNFNPASAYGYRNGSDVQSDSFVRALNQQAKAKSAGMTQAALSVPAGTGGTIKPYDDMQRLWANSKTRGLAGPSGADLIPRDGPYLAPPAQTASNGGVTGYLLDKLDAFQRSPWGHALQGLPPEGFIVGGAKAGLLGLAKLGQATDAATDAARVAVRIAQLEQEGHAVVRHGGSVTNAQLFNRAVTGVAPDGTAVLNKAGNVVIPPSSSAFNSDALLVHADQVIRDRYLDRALAISQVSLVNGQKLTIEAADIGQVIGRGYDSVSKTVGAVGPLQYVDNLSRATAVLQYNAATGRWNTVTIYPTR